MSHYALFTGADGAVMAAELDDDEPGDPSRDGSESDMGLFGRGPDGPSGPDVLPRAMNGLTRSLEQVVDQLRRLDADELKVDVGLKLSSQFGVAVAKGASEGHFTVTMTWRRGGMR